MLNNQTAFEISKTVLAADLDRVAAIDPSSQETKDHLDALMLMHYQPKSSKANQA